MPGPPIRLARALLGLAAVALVLAGAGLGDAGAQIPELPGSTLPPPSTASTVVAPLPTPVPLTPETTTAPVPEPSPVPQPEPEPTVLPAPAEPTTVVATSAPAAPPTPTAAPRRPAPAAPSPAKPDPGFSVTLPYPQVEANPPAGVLGVDDGGGMDRRHVLLAVAGGLLALALMSHLRWVTTEVERLR